MTDASISELEQLQAWLIDKWAEHLTAAGTSLQLEQEKVERLALVLDKAIRRLTVLNDQVSAALSRSSKAEGRDEGLLSVHVEASQGRVRRLVAFQETLAAMPGVARVSLHSIDHERAYIEVELEAEDSTA